MNIHVATKGLKNTSDELRKSEKNLAKICEQLEEAVKRLRHSDDENTILQAEKVSKILEGIRQDIHALNITEIALIKAAELYDRTEKRVQAFEDREFTSSPPELKTQNIGKIKDKTSKTFEAL